MNVNMEQITETRAENTQHTVMLAELIVFTVHLSLIISKYVLDRHTLTERCLSESQTGSIQLQTNQT